MKRIIRLVATTILFSITIFTLKSSNNIKAATYGHYTYEENSEGTVTITKYDGTAAENLVIPSTINGKSVTKIGGQAFYMCKNLTGNLVIPDSVTSIGEGAFSGCTGFTGSLTIPDSVTSIGEYAFNECSGLTGNLKIGSNVTNIGSCAFDGCSGFTGNLVIPKNVTEIGGAAFYNCSGFTGNLIIPDSVTSIGNSAFNKCSGFNANLVIGSKVTSIGSYAFYGCSGFTGNLTIPDSVTSIGEYAFCGCSGLTGNLLIGNSVKSIGSCAFAACSGFTGNLIIPDSVTSIGTSAFSECSGFNGNLVIGNKVTNIGGYAFYGCSGFGGSLTLGSSLTNIGEAAFSGCSGISGSLIIPDSVTSMGQYAFRNCSGFMGNLVVSQSITKIEYSTFSGCSGFTGNLIIPNSVVSIGSGAFFECSGFNGNLIIPNSVTSIGSTAFYNCKGLTGDLIIPKSITSIERDAFSGCSGFTGNLTIPDSVKNIGEDAFYNCRGFTGELIIPDSVTSIGKKAFWYCRGFTENLIIPESVANIGSSAFDYCYNINRIIFIENSPQIDSDSFSSYSKKIYYRKGTTGYTAANNWPTGQLVEYEESLKKDEYVINYLASGADREKIELNDILSEFVTPEFEVADTSIATVEQNGKIGYINPLKNGTTEVTVKLKYSDSVVRSIKTKITVDFKVTNIAFDTQEFRIESTEQTPVFTPTIMPNYAANKNVVWTSSDTNIATVDSNGKVIGITNGTCYITATTTDGSDLSASIKIVVDYRIPVTSVTLNKTSYTFTNNTPLQLKATVLPDNATNKEVTWESTNPSNLVVDQTGKVTVTSNSGSGMIIARAKDGSGKTAICNITINLPTTYISLNNSEYTLSGIGESVNLKATLTPSSMSQSVNWTSSNTSVATVNNSGKVTSVGIGTSVITATSIEDSNLKASCEITVEEVKVTSITLNKTSYTFTNTTPLQLTATVLPENATNKEIEWTSTNPSNIVVDQTGKVMVTSNKGSGMIIARAKDGSGKTAICNITVNIGGSAYKKGDINKDGKINVNDLNYGLRGLTRNTLTEEEKQLGDVNGDNKFNVNDLNKLLRYLVGKIKSLD